MFLGVDKKKGFFLTQQHTPEGKFSTASNAQDAQLYAARSQLWVYKIIAVPQ
jgi:hypothetical protein